MQHQKINEQVSCQICFPKDQEVVSTMHNLVKSLLSQYVTVTASKVIIVSRSLGQRSTKFQKGLDQLLKLMFASKLSAGQTCKHQVIHEFLKKKTKLSEDELDTVSQSIYKFLAKRNYEIEVLSSQVKYFPKSVIEDLNKKYQKNTLSTQQFPTKQYSKQKIPVPKIEYLPLDNRQEPVFLPCFFPTFSTIHFSSFQNKYV